MEKEATVFMRTVLGGETITVKIVGVGRAVWMFKAGATFIRFGCWLAGLGYEEGRDGQGG